MGHTLGEWVAKVAQLIRDPAGRDIGFDIEDVGLRPAFARFSVDRPYEAQAEVQGVGSAYFSAPAGWVTGLSSLSTVEFPARANPPRVLDGQDFMMVRDPTDVRVEKILLLSAAPTSTQWVRFTFTSVWPYPTNLAADDAINDLGFEAVAALATAFCLTSLAAEAARGRAAALPTNHVDGTQRARTLMEAAARYEGVYDRFLGLSPSANGQPSSSSPSSPAYGSFDLDPGRLSLFHGGRR